MFRLLRLTTPSTTLDFIINIYPRWRRRPFAPVPPPPNPASGLSKIAERRLNTGDNNNDLSVLIQNWSKRGINHQNVRQRGTNVSPYHFVRSVHAAHFHPFSLNRNFFWDELGLNTNFTKKCDKLRILDIFFGKRKGRYIITSNLTASKIDAPYCSRKVSGNELAGESLNCFMSLLVKL